MEDAAGAEDAEEDAEEEDEEDEEEEDDEDEEEEDEDDGAEDEPVNQARGTMAAGRLRTAPSATALAAVPPRAAAGI